MATLMPRLALILLAIAAIMPATASADGAWGGDPPLIACAGRQVMVDRTMKVYGTDLLGRQSIRYYLHATWCYRPSGRIARAAANAWGMTSTPGSMTPGPNIEGPTVVPQADGTVQINARGSFAYHWSVPSVKLATIYPWIGLTLLGGPNYSCVAGIPNPPRDQLPVRARVSVSKCVRATQGVL